MGKYFGTDGIRGIANLELTPQITYKVGVAIGYILKSENEPYVYVGKDSRISSPLLEYSLISGLLSMGVNVKRLHLTPSPAVAYLTASTEASYGVMISASHNPYYDNGIKVFNTYGEKITIEEESIIESILDGSIEYDSPINNYVGKVLNRHESIYQYIESLYFSVKSKFTGMKIGLDCANGSTSEIAKRLFVRLGAEVTVINDKPNGTNINQDCGSTYPTALQNIVVKEQLDVGFAFDGDGDRVIAVDNEGNIFDGDQMLYFFARELMVNDIVVTVMSNLGLKISLEGFDVKVHETQVGDKYVYEVMKRNDYLIGGEQSGHIIFRKYNTSGDGMLTALQLSMLLNNAKKKLSECRFKSLPQVLDKVKVKSKEEVMNNEELNIMIVHYVAEIAEKGRILVRPSGTESVIRVMVEHIDQYRANLICNEICSFIKELN